MIKNNDNQSSFFIPVQYLISQEATTHHGVWYGTMSSNLSIPIPTDSYDNATCDLATLTAIKTLVTCFDSTMDSLQESINKVSHRLDILSERTIIIQQRLKARKKKQRINNDRHKSINDDINISTVTFPAMYEHATQLQSLQNILYRQSSALSRAKQKSHDAVKSLLLEELSKNESCAVAIESNKTEKGNKEQKETTTSHAAPSDEWLDRPSAFEERSNCTMALNSDTVPPLLYDNSVRTMNQGVDYCRTQTDIKQEIEIEEAEYYQKAMEEELEDYHNHHHNRGTGGVTTELLTSPSIKQQQQQQHDDSSTLHYYDDNMSVISEFTTKGGRVGTTIHQNSAMYMNDSNTIVSNTYSTASHGTTSASRRRRQRKIRAMAEAAAAAASPSKRDQILKDGKSSSRMSSTALLSSSSSSPATNNNNNNNNSTTNSRQQVFNGSMSYVCDLLHDSYGIVDGKYGHVYPPVTNIHDLLIHDGTSNLELAYQEYQVNHDHDVTSSPHDDVSNFQEQSISASSFIENKVELSKVMEEEGTIED